MYKDKEELLHKRQIFFNEQLARTRLSRTIEREESLGTSFQEQISLEIEAVFSLLRLPLISLHTDFTQA